MTPHCNDALPVNDGLWYLFIHKITNYCEGQTHTLLCQARRFELRFHRKMFRSGFIGVYGFVAR